MLSFFQFGTSKNFSKTNLQLEEILYRLQYGHPVSEEDFDLILSYINYYSIKNYKKVAITDRKYFV